MKIFNLLKKKRIVKKINKALSISLYDWQIDYIFNKGLYHSECDYGRGNGKTLANVLKFLFSKGDIVLIDYRAKCFHNANEWLYNYAIEDNTTERRKRFFVEEVLRVYGILSNIKGLKIRKIKLV